MKVHHHLIIGFLAFHFLSKAQTNTSDTIKYNNVSALLNDNGVFFLDTYMFDSHYEVPKGSGKTPIFSSSFWFGGIDINNQLHLAAETYGMGTDFWPGPLSIGTALPGTNPFLQTLWHVSKDEINTHISNVGQPGYIMPNDILNWPAHGDTVQGQSYYLAPFVDVNQNGKYDPANGDYPCIKGDDAIYMILNDKGGIHTESGGNPIGLEMHYMFYQIGSNNDLNNTTFIDLLVVNRGTILLSDFYVTAFEDFEIGNYSDDYAGTDSTRNLIFGYNGDAYDDDNGGKPGYHSNPPAIGFMCLNDTMRKAAYFTGLSSSPMETYNWMRGCNSSGVPWQDAFGNVISYVWPDDPNDPSGLSEVTIGNPTGDRRMVMSVKKDYFGFQDTIKLSYAIIFSQDSSSSSTPNLASVTKLYQNADFTQNYFDTYLTDICQYQVLGLKQPTDITHTDIKIYPNPTKGKLFIEPGTMSGVSEVTIYDLSGRSVMNNTFSEKEQIELELDNEPGVYIIRIVNAAGEFSKKIVLE